MTAKEALEILSNKTRSSKKALDDAIEAAFEALEMQIPIKPILKDHDHDEYFSMSVECGNCGAALGSWDYGREFCNGSKERFIEQNLFCRRCGQALDWSDVE